MSQKNNSITIKNPHIDLSVAQKKVYDKCSFEIEHLKMEKESVEYGACTFTLNKLDITFRVAKITPTKTGQFVTIWKRNESGPIEPFNYLDKIDFIIISARNENRFGQFIFPKLTLIQKGIISGNNKEGKRGIRVYPPWDKAENKQAENTQKWQLDYFLEIPDDNIVDLTLAKKLLTKK